MFEVDVCYKIILESMFEQCKLMDIAEKLSSYIQASVVYVLNTGKIPAYAYTLDLHKSIVEILERKNITLAEYDRFKKEKAKEGHCVWLEQENLYLVKNEIIIRGRTIGYSVIIFSDFSQGTLFGEVSEIMCQVTADYFEEEDIELYGNIPMRKLIRNQVVFRKEQDSFRILEQEIQRGYLMVLFPDVGLIEDKAMLFQKIPGIWNICGLLFDVNSVTAVFWGVNLSNKKSILEKLARLDRRSCVSEIFEKLEMCKKKVPLLERMSLLSEIDTGVKVMGEKDWYVSVIYTYALPMIEEAGICNPSIQLLLKEDRRNHTELYYTLKTYLMCENSIAETANRLHIHRNTLVYRLKQIREFVDMDINDNKISRELLAYMMVFDISRQNEVEK